MTQERPRNRLQSNEAQQGIQIQSSGAEVAHCTENRNGTGIVHWRKETVGQDQEIVPWTQTT